MNGDQVYEWRSSIDGIISNKSSFETSNLSIGKHAIYFKVQDNKDYWSREEYTFVEIIAGYTTRPVINVFKINPEKLNRGESAVLTWDVSSATNITISPDIGNVLSDGTRIIYPEVDTTYTITASNSNGNTVKSVKIAVVQELVRTVDLFSIAAESGGVRFDGQLSPNPSVGVIGAGQVWEAFFSFDISMIPVGVKVKSTVLDITNYNLEGSPFSFLGGMGVIYDQYYGAVKATNYVTTFPVNTIYVAYTPPLQPYNNLSTLTEAVQKQVDKGDNRFQVRLQFQRYYYHEQNPSHYLSFLPDTSKLSITYEIP